MPQAPRIPKWFSLGLLIISFAGFLDAGYLTANFYFEAPIPCTILNGCEVVTKSSYATIGPVPLALLGALYYLTLFVLAVFYLDSGRERAAVSAAYLTIPGFLFSLRLVYLQIFVLKALCLYCIFSAVTSTLLFILAIFLLRSRKRGAGTVSV